MVCDKKFTDLAYELIKGKSSKDDIKAAEDLLVVDTILSGIKTCFNPWMIDKRLRQDYKTIEMMENIQSNFFYNDEKKINRNVTEDDRIMNTLRSDKVDIIADILIKHAQIKSVDELYKRI